MRISLLRTAASATAAAVLLAACSGAPSNNSVGLPQAAAPNGPGSSMPTRQRGTVARYLYAVGGNTSSGGAAMLKYRSWTVLGEVAGGSRAAWVDRHGNLYLVGITSVQEYDASHNFVTSYTSVFPFAVTTDRSGAVYVGDQQYQDVTVFSQGHGQPIFRCGVGTTPMGLAVDRQGDLFVSLGSSVIEYVGGPFAAGCAPTALPPTFLNARGLAVDPQGNLLVADNGYDYQTGNVYILAPPYTSITGTLGSGWSAPASVSVNKAGTRAFVVDNILNTITEFTYPGGSTMATIGAGSIGFTSVNAAVPNANYAP